MGILRTSQILLASSAYDDPEGLPLPIGADLLSLNYTYTLSTAGGATGAGYARLRPAFWVNGAWRRDVQIASLTSAADYVRAVIRQLELDLPNPPVSIVSNTISLIIPMGAMRFKCPAAEIGDATHPGLLALDIAASRRTS